MGLSTVRRDIEKRVQDNWVTTRVQYENVKFTEPKTNENWARLRIFEESANRMNIGQPPRHRHTGLIILELYVPENTGTDEIRTMADTFSDLFREAAFNGIQCRAPNATPVGVINGWYRYNVTVPYFWEGIYS